MLEQPTLAPPQPMRVVAVLGRGVVAPETPILRADDLGALRGDGIFETVHVRAGRAWLLDEHLTRMKGSAARLRLDLPDEAALRELTEQAVAAWPAQTEGALRLVCTRGAEAGSAVTVFATVGPVAAGMRRARREGITVLTATQGFPVGLRPQAPWLLGGAKTLSYAMNMACLRWAAEEGADDVLLTSTDGYALEAPTATLVWLAGDTLWTVPPEPTGILPGITARWLLDHAGELGWRSGERLVTPAEVTAADGAWLTSSVRGIAGIRTLDGTALRTADQTTARIRNLLGFSE